MAIQPSLIRKALKVGSFYSWRNLIGFVGYGTSLMMLLVSLSVFLFAQAISQQQAQSGVGYLTVGKEISMLNTLGFVKGIIDRDLQEKVKRINGVQSIAPITGTDFQTFGTASMGPASMSSALYLESVPTALIDGSTTDFDWQAGQQTVPVIVGREFLHLYNFGFAPSQGLPQVSESTIKQVNFELNLSSERGALTYKAAIIGFSDRFNTILVPSRFLDSTNARLGSTNKQLGPKRLVITYDRTNATEVIDALAELGLVGNYEQVRAGAVARWANIAAQLIGLIAIILLVIACTQLVTGQQLLLSAAAGELDILRMQGYRASDLLWPVYAPIALIFAIITLAVTSLMAWFNSYIGQLAAIETSYILPSLLVGSGLWLLMLALNWLTIKRQID